MQWAVAVLGECGSVSLRRGLLHSCAHDPHNRAPRCRRGARPGQSPWGRAEGVSLGHQHQHGPPRSTEDLSALVGAGVSVHPADHVEELKAFTMSSLLRDRKVPVPYLFQKRSKALCVTSTAKPTRCVETPRHRQTAQPCAR